MAALRARATFARCFGGTETISKSLAHACKEVVTPGDAAVVKSHSAARLRVNASPFVHNARYSAPTETTRRRAPGSLVERGADELEEGLVAESRRDAKALVDTARIHREQGKPDDAIAVLWQAVDLEPSNQRVQLELAEAKPDHPEAQGGLGLAQLLAERYNEALAPPEQAAKLMPDDPCGRLNLAVAYKIDDLVKKAAALAQEKQCQSS